MTRIAIYDTTLRDGSQGEGVNFSLQDKLLITAPARRAGRRLHRGRLSALEPEGRRVLPARSATLPLKHAKVAAFGMTRRKDVAAERRHRHEGPARRRRRRSSPSSARRGTSTSPRCSASTLDENLAMIADSVAYCAAQGREVIYDAEHFFDGYKAQPRVRAADARRPPQDAGRGGRHPVRHQRRHAARRRSPRPSPSVRPTLSTSPLGIHMPQRLRPGRGQLAGRRRRRGRRRCRARSTASASAAATSTSSASIANLALEARLRGAAARQPGASDRAVALRLRDRQHELPHRPAVRRRQRLRPQGRHARARRRQATPASYEHIDPAPVGNERRVLVSELSGPVEHPGQDGEVRHRRTTRR